MAKNIEKIADAFGEDVTGQVPEGGSSVGADHQLRAVEAVSQADAEDPLIGSMRDYADEMDHIVEDAMRRRQISGWLPDREDFSALEAISEATGQPLHTLLDEALRQFLRLSNAETAEGA